MLGGEIIINIDNLSSFRLGSCGDAWRLCFCGDDMDIISHRPFANKFITPVGLCCDANILVLYPEREQIDWDNLIGEGLKNGCLCSGAKVKIIYLNNKEYKALCHKRKITIEQIKKIARNSNESFLELEKEFRSLKGGE